MTDWKPEIELRLGKSKIYSTLEKKLDIKGDAVKSQQLNLIFQSLLIFQGMY